MRIICLKKTQKNQFIQLHLVKILNRFSFKFIIQLFVYVYVNKKRAQIILWAHSSKAILNYNAVHIGCHKYRRNVQIMACSKMMTYEICTKNVLVDNKKKKKTSEKIIDNSTTIHRTENQKKIGLKQCV